VSMGRLVLINSILTMVIFILSFFEVLRGVLEKIDYNRSQLYCHSDQHKKKYRLIKWNIIYQPKDQGGL
jgi:hypothetical protein